MFVRSHFVEKSWQLETEKKDAKEASNENGKVGIARTEPNRVSAAWVDLAGLVNLTTNPPPKKWPALLLMAEIGRSPVEVR